MSRIDCSPVCLLCISFVLLILACRFIMEKKSLMLSSASRAPTKRGKHVTMTRTKKAAIIKLVEGDRSQADVAKEFKISKHSFGLHKKQAKDFGSGGKVYRMSSEKCKPRHPPKARGGPSRVAEVNSLRGGPLSPGASLNRKLRRWRFKQTLKDLRSATVG